MFPTIVSCLTLRIAHIYFTWRNLLLNSTQQRKMNGHHTCFQESDDLPLWQGPAAKEKPPFFNARTLITLAIMRSRDAQCNTGE